MWGECAKCGDRFPCPRDCEHEDCSAARESCCEWGFRFQEETGLPAHEHPGDCKDDHS